MPAHKGMIHTLTYAEEKILSGGNDRIIHLWDPAKKVSIG